MSPEPIFPQQPSHISRFFLFFEQNSRKAAKSHDRQIGSARRDGGEHVTVCVYTGKKKKHHAWNDGRKISSQDEV